MADKLTELPKEDLLKKAFLLFLPLAVQYPERLKEKRVKDNLSAAPVPTEQVGPMELFSVVVMLVKRLLHIA